MKITDFGNKIGGARKDLWKRDGITLSDLALMNRDEKIRYVNRDGVWPLPNAKMLVEEEHVLPFVAYWQRKIRLTLQKEPLLRDYEDTDKAIDEYVRQARVLYDLAMNCKTIEDVDEAEEIIRSWQLHKRYLCFTDQAPVNLNCVRTEIFRIPYYRDRFKRYVIKNNFPYQTKKTSETRKRKGQFIPPQLEKIEREGENYRHGAHVTPDKWQKIFNFYGVEFGVWTSQKDRQVSMDYCFDALKDLATVLGIEDVDVAFSGKLSLAFGARGCSHASAHYEMLRRVINLTKMHGAGCTAHEWFHALDHFIAMACKVPDGQLASETKYQSLLPESYVSLIHALKKDEYGNETDYLKGSKAFDGQFAKDAYGYWSSNAEMVARAFACYVKDCLGCKSDYLIAHADSYEFEYDDKCLCAIPQGEEREIFNELFDQLFYELKELGLLHKRTYEVPKVSEEVESYSCDYDLITSEDINGQYSFHF